MGYISAQTLEGERSKSFAVSISLQTKAINSYFRVPETGKYPPSSRISTRSWSKSRCAHAGLGYSLSRKWWGTIFRPKSSKVFVQKLLLCEFHCKPSPSGVSLESPGLENIPQVPGKRAEVAQKHDARHVVSATVSVLKWSVAILRPQAPKWAFKKFCCVHLTANQGNQELV